MSDSPVTIGKLLAGHVRVLRAPITAPVPEGLEDIIDLLGDGDPVAPWVDFGATTDASSYERGIAQEDYEIQQRNGRVISEVTETTRSFEVPIAEISAEHIALLEEANSITSKASAPGVSAQKIIRGGSIEELTRYRIAFVARRKKSQALVTEPGGATRGAYVVGVLLNAAVAADSVSLELGKGSLASIPVTFEAFPEESLPADESQIMWIEEQAGTIAA